MVQKIQIMNNKKADGTTIETVTTVNQPAVGSQEWLEEIKQVHEFAWIWIQHVAEHGHGDNWTSCDTGVYYMSGSKNNNLPCWRTVQDMDGVLQSLIKAKSLGLELADFDRTVDGIIAFYLSIVKHRTKDGPVRVYDPVAAKKVLEHVNSGSSLEDAYGKIVLQSFQTSFTGTSGSNGDPVVIQRFLDAIGSIVERRPLLSVTGIDDFIRFVLPTIDTHVNFYRGLTYRSYGTIIAGDWAATWDRDENTCDSIVTFNGRTLEAEKIISEMILDPSSIVIYDSVSPSKSMDFDWYQRTPNL